MYPFDQEKLASLLESAQIDLALVNSRHNLRYLTNYYFHFHQNFTRIDLSQYLPLLGLPARNFAESFYVGISYEMGQMESEGVWVGNRYESPRSVTGAAEKAWQLIESLGLGAGRIGVEMGFLPADAYVTLQTNLPQATIVDVQPVLDELRAIKTERELALIRNINDQVAESICATFGNGRDGITTREISDAVRLEIEQRGMRFVWSLTGAGPSFMKAPSQAQWTAGNVLHLDCGGEIDDYVADICRMGCLGRPSQLATELHAACLEVQDKVRRLIKPGVPCDEIYHAALEAAGSSPFAQYGNFDFHGMGMVSHEHPYIEPSNSRLLAPGMVLSIETEYMHPEVGAVKLEDAAAVTADGCEGYGDQGRELQIV